MSKPEWEDESRVHYLHPNFLTIHIGVFQVNVYHDVCLNPAARKGWFYSIHPGLIAHHLSTYTELEDVQKEALLRLREFTQEASSAIDSVLEE